MDILDLQRINALIPCLIFYGLQDIIFNIKIQLVKIRKYDKHKENNFKFKINEWTVNFDTSFDCLSLDTKLILISGIEGHTFTLKMLVDQEYDDCEPVKTFKNFNKIVKKYHDTSLRLSRMELDSNNLLFNIYTDYKDYIGRFSVNWTIVC